MEISGSDKLSVQILVKQAKSYGLSNIVFSPGSRNAPFVFGFDEDPYFSCIVIPDERSAAFFALGMAIASNKPVAICCTSGSALLNYYPAIAEAFYQRIPLVVLSADRPKEWIDMGDGQTIRQSNVFANHIDFQKDIEEISDVEQDKIWFAQREIANAFNIALHQSGPVHLNFYFNEPLYKKAFYEIKDFPKRQYIHNQVPDLNDSKELIERWNTSKKRMILIGQMQYDASFQNELRNLAKDTSIIILVENTSNLISEKYIHCIDRTLNSIDLDNEDYQPDLLVTFGGAVISKKIKAYLRKSKLSHHISVNSAFPNMDTYGKLSFSVAVEPDSFLNIINSHSEINNTNFGSKWKQIDYQVKDLAKGVIETLPWSDLTVMNCILDYIIEGSVLHLSNSSVVRYAQLYDSIEGVIYQCNRGTSGIDGSMSTAAGYAYTNQEKINVIVTGDISFFYDSNALWNNYLSSNLRIILIHNGGGDIFNIISEDDQIKQQKKYFVTENNFSAEGICQAFGIGYQKITDMPSLEAVFNEFYDVSDRPKLIEIDTSSQRNHKILKEYFEKIRLN